MSEYNLGKKLCTGKSASLNFMEVSKWVILMYSKPEEFLAAIL